MSDDEAIRDDLRHLRNTIATLADTIDARVDAGQPLSVAQLRSLVHALREVVEPVWDNTRHERLYLRAEAQVTLLRPTW